MAFLYSLDKAVFLFLNRSVANPVFDVIMPFITEANHWRIPLLLAWLSLVIFGGKKGRIAALMAVVILTLSDQISSSVIKPFFERVRPCFVLDNVRLLIDQPRSPSFPSSHAANNAAMAMLFSVKYRRHTWIFVSIAATVAYTRIYVGVHYPSDAIGGALVGILCAAVILGLEWGIRHLWRRRKESVMKKSENN